MQTKQIDPLNLLFANKQGDDAKRWYSQGLSFAPTIKDVLLQKKGGPCGVLAALQAHVILHTVFLQVSDPTEALTLSIWKILDRARRTPCVSTDPILGPSSMIIVSKKIENMSMFDPQEEILKMQFTSENEEKAYIRKMVTSQYSGEAGVMLFVLSLMYSRGPERVKSDMDDPEALMTGQFGHCGQEMLNLIITGQAASQVFDGTVEVADSGMHLRGVASRPQVGLLTRLEALRYCRVGSFLKNPEYPIWVIGSESHFTVLYSTDRNCDAKSMEQEVFEKGKRAFSSRDTQENGFVKTSQVDEILRELGLVPTNEKELRVMNQLILKCQMPGSEGIVIWTDFWPVIGQILRSGKGLKDLPDPAWSCTACTFLNEDTEAKVCVVCNEPRRNDPQQAQQQQQRQQQTPWICSACTLRNNGTDSTCQACGGSRASQIVQENSIKESESGGRTFTLIHVDGLEKKVGGVIHPPRKTELQLTTVDPFLATPGTFGEGLAFEEALQTKWVGALFNYGAGGPPSIVG